MRRFLLSLLASAALSACATAPPLERPAAASGNADVVRQDVSSAGAVGLALAAGVVVLALLVAQDDALSWD